MVNDKYLKIARAVTQEFIESYGANWACIDELDRMIAEAIEKAISKEFADFFNNLDEL
jgi:hypothetical protein